MSTTNDALLALRQAVKSRSQITYSNASGPTDSLASATHIALSPSLSLPKSTPTRLRKPGASSTDPSSNPQDFFSLDAVYLAWLLRDASGAEYVKQTRENGLAVGFVSVTERKSLVDWLEGRTSDLSNIVPLVSESTTPPGTPPHVRSSTALPPTPAARGIDSAATPSKRRYVSDTADIEVVKKIKQNEIELQDRNTVLRGVKPNNFSNVRSMYADKLKKLKEAGKGGGSLAATSHVQDPKMLARKAKSQDPIIIISSSPSAVITMYNVKRFLQESVFERSADARARAVAEGNPRPEDVIPVYRKRTDVDTSSGRQVEINKRYFVVDSTDALAKFGADAWDRVVCVVTTGQEWQFRPYKWPEPKALFHHVKGIYFYYANEAPSSSIKEWNVTELKIDQSRRHVDKSVVASFWKTLDAWTHLHKPWLAMS